MCLKGNDTNIPHVAILTWLHVGWEKAVKVIWVGALKAVSTNDFVQLFVLSPWDADKTVSPTLGVIYLHLSTCHVHCTLLY